MKKKKILVLLLVMKVIIVSSQHIKDVNFERNSIDPVLMSNALLNYTAFKDENSKKIIDSLKVIDRSRLKTKIIGTWKFIEAKCSCCVPIEGKGREEEVKYIKIEEDSIYFFTNRIAKKRRVRAEKMIFTNQLAPFSDLTNIVFTDKSLWSLKTDMSHNFLQIYMSGKETKDGRTSAVSGLVYEYYKRVE